jgi:hypothetical protein
MGLNKWQLLFDMWLIEPSKLFFGSNTISFYSLVFFVLDSARTDKRYLLTSSARNEDIDCHIERSRDAFGLIVLDCARTDKQALIFF